MSTPEGGTAAAVPAITDPVRPKRLPGTPGAGAALFGASLAALLISVANVHKSRQAERLAHTVDRTELAPRFDDAELPAKTEDGRTIPRERRLQVGNVLQKLWDRGELPDPATCGLSLSFATIKLVAMEVAALDDGTGCWMGLRKLERKLNRDERTIREACEYLRDHAEMMLTFGRVGADDRKIGGAKEPQIDQRTTVRLVFSLPRSLARRLTRSEILDLVAAGEKKPAAELEPWEGEPPPVQTPPKKAQPTVRKAPAPAAAGASPSAWWPRDGHRAEHEHALDGELARMREVTGLEVPRAWIVTHAQAEDARLSPGETIDAMRELANDIAKERSAATALQKSWRPPAPEQLLARAGKYLTGKRTWLDKHGPEAKATAESKKREAEYRAAYKTPEQNEREDGVGERPADPEPQTTSDQRRRLDLMGYMFELEERLKTGEDVGVELARVKALFDGSISQGPPE